jgi:Na+/pantothenate symporter
MILEVSIIALAVLCLTLGGFIGWVVGVDYALAFCVPDTVAPSVSDGEWNA